MDNDGKFWCSIWSIVGLVFAAVFLMITSCTQHRNQLVADMVAKGADPVEARMAVANDYNTDSMTIYKAVAK